LGPFRVYDYDLPVVFFSGRGRWKRPPAFAIWNQVVLIRANQGGIRQQKPRLLVAELYKSDRVEKLLLMTVIKANIFDRGFSAPLANFKKSESSRFHALYHFKNVGGQFTPLIHGPLIFPQICPHCLQDDA
jgi:hypothetical protein